MTSARSIANAKAAAEWLLQSCAKSPPPLPPRHVLIEWALSINGLANRAVPAVATSAETNEAMVSALEFNRGGPHS